MSFFRMPKIDGHLKIRKNCRAENNVTVENDGKKFSKRLCREKIYLLRSHGLDSIY